MLFDSEDNELVTNNKSILTGFNSFDLLFDENSPEASATSQTSNFNQSKSSFLVRFLNSYSNRINNFILDLIYDLHSQCIEPSFEFKILIFLLLTLLFILFLVAVNWKFFGSLIDSFYKNKASYLSERVEIKESNKKKSD